MEAIRQILDINNDINYTYRTSKLPKFLKNIEVKKSRKRLIKSIDQLTNYDFITYDILKEYLEFIYLTYPPNGTYGHIASTKKSIYDQEGNTLIGSTVSYDLQTEKNKFDVICDIVCANGNIKLEYHIRMNNNPRLSFTDNNKIYLKKEDLGLIKNEYSNEFVAALSRNNLIDFLNEDMHQFLIDNIERAKMVQELSDSVDK